MIQFLYKEKKPICVTHLKFFEMPRKFLDNYADNYTNTFAIYDEY